MPVFEYKCEDCGSRFEELVRCQQDEIKSCSQCGSRQLTKLISGSKTSIKNESSVNSAQTPSCNARGLFS